MKKNRPFTIPLGNGIHIGGKELVLIAGPCAIENELQLMKTAEAVQQAGVGILRGGSYKPRTNPRDFEGLGKEGLQLLSSVAKKLHLLTVTEIIDPRDIDIISSHSDIFQVGTRNMMNYALLKEIGKTRKPVILKRGMSSTIKEFLLAADHILMNGNPNVILCERGIRTFETETRNTLALETIPLVHELSHLPIIVDPSHSTGKANLVAPMSKAAIAAGTDGLLIDVHWKPEEALCDAEQALNILEFKALIKELKPLAKIMGRIRTPQVRHSTS